MGNAQDKPSGAEGTKTDQSTPGFRRRSRAGSTEKPRAGKGPPSKESVVNGATQGDRSRETPPDSSYLDVPAGALPPHLARLKNEGNHLFKNGQFADAVEKYSAAINGCCDAGTGSPEDLCILYSNRAACYLKDGSSTECIQDCTRALELQPFALKPLLRRAMAYESMERYRQAYVDYKTVLQIDIGVQSAHDSVHRITKQLIEQDGPEWREKLPEIPLVPMSAQQHHRQKDPSVELVQAREAKKAEARFASLKTEGNDNVRKGLFRDGLEKYSECLQIKPDDCSCFTNRAICYLRLGCFEEAKKDCDSALKLEPTNKKAFYRRALAYKGLQDYLAASSDLQEVLQLDPNVQEAEQELETVTVLLRQSLMDGAQTKPRV
ncbi:sperm-associated antigen 1A [Esox lucius]|uniref:Sperm associated antigen 1a n=1 Tax=Esox lucius TaxID=8010 RepID=A0A3P8YEX5_ESOLU|nr:sperm-associated antigen 1A [Esox lucius]